MRYLQVQNVRSLRTIGSLKRVCGPRIDWLSDNDTIGANLRWASSKRCCMLFAQTGCDGMGLQGWVQLAMIAKILHPQSCIVFAFATRRIA